MTAWVTDAISSLTWQIVTTLLVAAVLLGVAVLALRRQELPSPEATDGGPPAVEVRHLHKIYGQPGPVGRAWRVQQRFAEAVRKFGGRAFHPSDAWGRLIPLALVLALKLVEGASDVAHSL